MRTFLYFLAGIAVMGLAFWAYQENYQTQRKLKQSAALNSDIGRLRETLGMLKAEWAYLNRPARLNDLAELNFDELGLMPLMPEQFGRVDQVAFPAPDLGPITDPVDISGELEEYP
ncbi:cell division protein FtsL [Alphaproteobacteria bacterium KMM 3653]|uniref:Cell division protein FtsL n=1 Tax=Harenicola maris TaxID=2841044 RepID=A0AAP2G2Q2_9RHOB|nr:cell division protein FtsL [Harenicola maris]